MVDLKDLKTGMYLKNNCPTVLNLILNSWTGKENNQFLSIPGGGVIGQIVDFVDSSEGPAVVFYSKEIKNASASVLGLNTEYYLLGWLTDMALPTAWIPWSKLQPCISDSQIEQQNVTFAKIKADGNTFKNQITQVAKDTGEAAGSAASGLLSGLGGNIGWWLAGGVGLYLIYNSKKFQDTQTKRYV